MKVAVRWVRKNFCLLCVCSVWVSNADLFGQWTKTHKITSKSSDTFLLLAATAFRQLSAPELCAARSAITVMKLLPTTQHIRTYVAAIFHLPQTTPPAACFLRHNTSLSFITLTGWRLVGLIAAIRMPYWRYMDKHASFSHLISASHTHTLSPQRLMWRKVCVVLCDKTRNSAWPGNSSVAAGSGSSGKCHKNETKSVTLASSKKLMIWKWYNHDYMESKMLRV